MKFYYGFEYTQGRNTKTGAPHPITHNQNISGNVFITCDYNTFCEWINNGKPTPQMPVNCREAITRDQLRLLHLGMTIMQFADYTYEEEKKYEQTKNRPAIPKNTVQQ